MPTRCELRLQVCLWRVIEVYAYEYQESICILRERGAARSRMPNEVHTDTGRLLALTGDSDTKTEESSAHRDTG